ENCKPLDFLMYNMNEMINTAIRAAKEAGEFLLDNFGKIEKIESKGDRNLATNLDKEAEKMIVDRILAKFPGHGIFAEEGGKYGSHKGCIWIIDPLDGTHNYVRDIKIFGVSIGIVKNEEFIGGVIYIPSEREMYAAEKGGGAYKNNKRIAVSSKAALKECSISFDSSIRYKPQVMLKVLGELADNVFNIRMLGSSARALSYIAEGKLDASVEFYDQPWDFAGGACIIKEAGGEISALKGGPLNYKSTGYIASNGILHDRIIKIVSKRL
ncbi:MAG: inositol monophosphatase, partial [Candidatus Omnitrophica bacterium]|nr:inositol monophosphatase [Candidatus Omnitrophota bacterium]